MRNYHNIESRKLPGHNYYIGYDASGDVWHIHAHTRITMRTVKLTGRWMFRVRDSRVVNYLKNMAAVSAELERQGAA